MTSIIINLIVLANSPSHSWGLLNENDFENDGISRPVTDMALFHEQSNMNPLITEVCSSLPCTDLTAKGDDISWVGIVSTKTRSIHTPLPPPPPYTHTHTHTIGHLH